MAETRTMKGAKLVRQPRLPQLIAQLWHGLVKDLFDPYRPERHYMRGPGPKWHAKHPLASH